MIQPHDDWDFCMPVSNEIRIRWNNFQKQSRETETSISRYWKLRRQDIETCLLDDSVRIRGLYLGAHKSRENFVGKVAKLLRQTLTLAPLRRLRMRRADAEFIRSMGTQNLLLQGETDNYGELRNRYESNYKNKVREILGGAYDERHWFSYAKNYDILMAIKKVRSTSNSLLEIGPGAGHFALFAREMIGVQQIVLVDLPETMCVSYFFLAQFLEPDQIVLPNEEISHETVVRFCTPSQLESVSGFFDLLVNVTSFQEMNQRLVRRYMHAIARLSAAGSVFACINRLSKETHWLHYPWPRGFKTVAHEEDTSSRGPALEGKRIMRRILIKSKP